MTPESPHWPRGWFTSASAPLRVLLQFGKIADARCYLGRNIRRSRRPGYVLEVEEFRHINLGGIPIGKRRQIETGLNQFEDRGVIRCRMRDEILLRVGRDYDERHSEAGKLEIADILGAAGTNISWQQIRRRNAVGLLCGLGWNVVVGAASFVEGEDED